MLAIDQAKRSGWAVHDLSRVVLHGAAEGSLERRVALRRVRALPGFDFARLLVVLEDHSHIPASKEYGTVTVLGLGEARGRWHELLDIYEHPMRQRMLVTPREWRRVLGTRVNLSRDAWKGQAKMWASCTLQKPIADDDEAEAIVMATWGAVEGIVRWAKRRAEKKRRSA